MLNYIWGIVIGACMSCNTDVPKEQVKTVSSILTELYSPESDYVMICAHRGNIGEYPENSIQGLKECISTGIDIIEIDLKETKDGHIIIMHDDTLGRSTTGSGRVSELNLSEIKKESLKLGSGEVAPTQKVPTLEEFLSVAKGRILLQIDKWLPVKDKALRILEDNDCLGQSIFRGTYSSGKVKSLFGEYLEKIIYIPVIVTSRKGSMDKLEDYTTHLKTPAISFIFNQEKDTVLNEVIRLKKKYRIWYNAILQNDSCAGHGDITADKSLSDSYGWLVRKGGNIIFTDKALLLDAYLRENRWR